MTVICNLTVKMPFWRIRAMRLAIFIIAPFVRDNRTGEKIVDVMSAWVGRGLRVYADNKRVG